MNFDNFKAYLAQICMKIHIVFLMHYSIIEYVAITIVSYFC